MAEVFHTSQAYRHEKRADEVLTLAQNSVGVQLVSHRLLERLDVLETARNNLLAGETAIAAVILPLLEAWRAVRARTAELDRRLIASVR